jgi:hypothetical protein
MTTIFPDIEKLMVARINAGLAASTDPVADNVLVSVSKPSADETPYPSKIITVRSDGGAELARNLTRSEMIGVNVWATTFNDATTLARITESFIRHSASGEIKLVETTMSPVRVDNDGPQEQRYMTFRITTKASDN